MPSALSSVTRPLSCEFTSRCLGLLQVIARKDLAGYVANRRERRRHRASSQSGPRRVFSDRLMRMLIDLDSIVVKTRSRPKRKSDMPTGAFGGVDTGRPVRLALPMDEPLADHPDWRTRGTTGVRARRRRLGAVAERPHDTHPGGKDRGVTLYPLRKCQSAFFPRAKIICITLRCGL